jgi:hypothetical protein
MKDCQPPPIGTEWFAIATGAKTTCFCSYWDLENPVACHCGCPGRWAGGTGEGEGEGEGEG